MGQTQSAFRNDQSEEKSVVGLRGVGGVAGERSLSSKNGSSRYIGKTTISTTAAATTTTTTAAIPLQTEESVATQQQRLKQTSNWSLGSLSGRLNWSFTGSASKNSYRGRNKSSRKSLTSLHQQQKQQQQQDHQLRRSKTVWHKPLTNAIFSSHFKESSRNDEFYIEDLVAKGAFGVVFKVIDKRAKVAQVQQSTDLPLLSQSLSLSPSPSSLPLALSSSTSSPSPPQKQPEKSTTSSSSTTTTTKIKTPNSITFALKVLKKSKIIQENSVQQLKDEADIQKLCGHHPFIVQQIDSWQNRRNLHILSEFVPNGELFEKIAHFSVDLIRLYLAEIAIAIDFLHNAGIIYRDAKPENILLTADFHIKLIDFGLSKWLKQGATTKTMCGTFQYMAPEILRGEPYGHAVDWWSLGVIVCQMLIKKAPDVRQFIQISLPPEISNKSFDLTDNIQSAPSNISANLNNDIKNSDFLPAEVDHLIHESKDVLKRLLTIDPKQRIRSVMALQKIAMYKNFKIDSKHLLNIRPLDIINRDNLTIYTDEKYNESSSIAASEAFQNF